jgi:phosphoribosylglycinamide formyltransferase 2
VRTADDVDAAWDYAQTGGRAGAGRVIVEGFIDFDYEITLLTVRHAGGTDFCDPIGHLQRDGDYRESWQPQPMSAKALERAQAIAKTITDDLGGWGLFGVELFVKGDEVWFSEVSPRPHDTGLVTLISQDLSEFALHARAILGLPIPSLRPNGPSASCAVLAQGHGVPAFSGVADALRAPDTALRLFGKPKVEGHRRVAVTLALGADIDEARAKARDAAAALSIELR